ncbi:hypothetical protein [Methylophilus sp.]|uniref:hypothetical protein n=1 Tax=Methylophilus sp. TaxID=29541 RepID=UPI0011DA1BCF|nr:hypothetical protein [Methylophilus sp.]TXI44509.1 MAG: hypothetical protein E6Q52_09020 [Methylophilus sp.]
MPIDWSATGTWFTGLLGVGVAIYALNSWKKQIVLQDKYAKLDGLLEAFVTSVRAGFDWQHNVGVGENRCHDKSDQGEAYTEWRKSLMNYRVHWYKSRCFINSAEDQWLSPDQLQNKIITIAQHLEALDSSHYFHSQMSALLEKGLADIDKNRES